MEAAVLNELNLAEDEWREWTATRERQVLLRERLQHSAEPGERLEIRRELKACDAVLLRLNPPVSDPI